MIGYSRPAGWQLKLDEARQPPVSGTVPWQHGRQKKKDRRAQSDSVPAGAGEFKHQITALKYKGERLWTIKQKK